MRIARGAALTLVRAALIAAVLWPIVYWGGGLVEIETTQFIRQYLDGRSVLQKIFDPHGNDLGTYQARELSYAIDLVDATVFGRLVEHGITFLVPASALAASAVTLLVFYTGWRATFPHLHEATAGLVLLTYLTNFTFLVTTGLFYRSAKPVLAPVVLALLFCLYRAATARTSPAAGRWWRSRALHLFLLTSLASLLDRQGFFYSLMAVGWTGVQTVRRRSDRDLFIAALAGTGVTALYNVQLAPLIVHAVNGYWPDFRYQQVPLLDAAGSPLRFWQATVLALESANVLLGSAPWWAYGVAGAALWALGRHGAIRHGWSRADRGGVPARSAPEVTTRARLWALAFIVGFHVLMFSLMIVRHPPVFEWRDHRLWYYPLTFQITLAFCLLAAAAHAAERARPALTVLINGLLVAAILGNVARWPDHHRVMIRSRWFPTVYSQSEILKSSLRERRLSPSLNVEFGALYEYLADR